LLLVILIGVNLKCFKQVRIENYWEAKLPSPYPSPVKGEEGWKRRFTLTSFLPPQGGGRREGIYWPPLPNKKVKSNA